MAEQKKFNIYWNFLLQPQYFIFVLVSIYRLVKYWHAGQFNPKFAPRSWSFLVKYLLQLVMIVANLTFTVEITKSDGEREFSFDYLDIVYAVYALIWMLSIYVQYFEYKKGLPHSWYCH